MNSSKNTFEYINEWAKSEKTFRQQLFLNLKELQRNYPPHWLAFLEFISIIGKQITTVVDVGCGCGSLYQLCQKHQLGLDYIGYDYSQPAINVATAQWGNHFLKQSYQDLRSEDIPPKSVIVANGLADILPDGDDCINKLLSLQCNYVILLRIRITDQPSYFKTYSAYNITIYEFYHNDKQLQQMFKTSGYVGQMLWQDSQIANILLEKDHK